MLDERTETIKEILEIFGTTNQEIISLLSSGKSLADFLKSQAVIYPIEYDKILSAKTDNFGTFVDSLNLIAYIIRKKQRIYRAYVNYCNYFLGEEVSYVDLSIMGSERGSYKQFSRNDLRDENGNIDYTPYLSQLRANNLTSDSENTRK